MKNKNTALLLVFILGLFFPDPGAAAAVSPHPVDTALDLLYFSDAVLAGMTDLESVLQPAVPVLFSPASNPSRDEPDNASLAAAIQAAKEKRNDLDASCSLLVSKYRAAGQDCEADRIQAACDERRQGLNSEIGRLHDLRGDRRRPLTKAWHWLKRQGQGVWRRIGPEGRNFLRQVGPEALQVVASGGTLSGGALRNIIKQHFRALGRQRIREVVYQGVERLLVGQLDLARAAGVDICDPGKEGSAADQGSSSSSQISYQLTTAELDFAWQTLLEPEDPFHSCGGLWPDEDERFQPITFPLQIDPKNQTLIGQLSGSREIVNQAEGDTGPIVTRIKQDFLVRLEGPYTVAEVVEGVVITLSGTAKLTLTQDGEVECHYWVIPDQGDPVLEKYWVSRVQTIDLEKPYEIRIYTPDENTRELELMIYGVNWGVNSFFILDTLPVTISVADLILLWPD